MMRLAADVDDGKQGLGGNLALERERVLLRVGAYIPREVARKTGDAQEVRPVYVGIRITRGGIQGWELQWKTLPIALSSGGRHIRIAKDRRRGAGVGLSVGSVAGHHTGGDAFDRGEKSSCARTNAALTRSAKQPAQKASARR